MAKPPKEAYELSDAEKRDLIQFIQQGQVKSDLCAVTLNTPQPLGPHLQH